MGFDKSQCRPLGTIIGKGGGSFGGGFISNEELIQYAMNDLRNEAARIGANVVHHSPPQLGTSGGRDGSDVSSANITGTAYLCSGVPGEPRPGAPGTTPAGAPAAAAIQTTTLAKGGRLLQLTLPFPEAALDLSFTTEQPDNVWIGVRGNGLNNTCEPMVMVDGTVKKYAYHQGSLPNLAFLVPMSDFEAMIGAQRVVGRVCQFEWRVEGGVKTQLTEFKGRIMEERAWNQQTAKPN